MSRTLRVPGGGIDSAGRSHSLGIREACCSFLRLEMDCQDSDILGVEYGNHLGRRDGDLSMEVGDHWEVGLRRG